GGWGATVGGHGAIYMSTGPIPAGVTEELRALKEQLVSMGAADMPAPFAEAMAIEISAIRLQLKRLEADREWVSPSPTARHRISRRRPRRESHPRRPSAARPRPRLRRT